MDEPHAYLSVCVHPDQPCQAIITLRHGWHTAALQPYHLWRAIRHLRVSSLVVRRNGQDPPIEPIHADYLFAPQLARLFPAFGIRLEDYCLDATDGTRYSFRAHQLLPPSC